MPVDAGWSMLSKAAALFPVLPSAVCAQKHSLVVCTVEEEQHISPPSSPPSVLSEGFELVPITLVSECLECKPPGFQRKDSDNFTLNSEQNLAF